MKNITWQPKYSVYPFTYPNGIKGQLIVIDKNGVDVIIYYKEKEKIHFKHFEKAMLYVQTELNKNI